MPEIKTETTEHKNPTYSECYAGSWNIRLYDHGETWLACFFHVDLWHEHVTAASRDAVLTLAHKTIDARIAEGK